jgi:hypothetical protein
LSAEVSSLPRLSVILLSEWFFKLASIIKISDRKKMCIVSGEISKDDFTDSFSGIPLE